MRRDVLTVSPLNGVSGNANSFEKAFVRELPIPGGFDIRLHIEQAPFVVTENDQVIIILKRRNSIWLFFDMKEKLTSLKKQFA